MLCKVGHGAKIYGKQLKRTLDIKIEPPEGDPCRQFHAMLGGDLPTNPAFELDNRSKRSICLDLSKPAAREEDLSGADEGADSVSGHLHGDCGEKDTGYSGYQEDAGITH